VTKAVIFDFDGTIADSFQVFVKAIEVVLKRKQPLSDTEIAGLRSSSTLSVMRQLGVRKWQLPYLGLKGRREILNHMADVEIFDGISDVLNELYNSEHKLFIVSSNSQEAILTFLERYKLENTIERIYANVSIFGKAKVLKKLLRKEGLLADECVYVGDEIRDVEAAAKAQIRCIAVTWGYRSVNNLKAYGTKDIVSSPKDLFERIGAPGPLN
jgi:phosphoglycolate phosphatase